MALIGAIIGDIIGSQYEFDYMRPDNLDWKHCKLLTDKCVFTDDTVMSIATKYAIDQKKPFDEIYRVFYNMFPNVGYGDKFERWAEGRNPYGSYGNGSAMRVSYIGDIVQDIQSVTKLAESSASCTHNSKSGIRGAIATVLVITMAKLKYTKSDIYNIMHEKFKNNIYDCSESLEELRKNYQWSETCDGTVPVAIRCFLESKDYESCIRNCLSLPCDMDAMCCIAGGMAEAYYGTTGLNNKEILQKYLHPFLYDCVKDMLFK